MRSKYNLWFAIGMLCFYTFISSETVFAVQDDKDIALIFVTSTQQPNLDVMALQEMLQVYTSVDVLAIEEIDEQMLQRYKRLVILNAYPTAIPGKALAAVNRFQGSAILIGENALQFSPFAKWQQGQIVELRTIGGESLDNPVKWKSVLPSADFEVMNRASSMNESYPFIVKKNNWAYIGDFVNRGTLQYQWPSVMGDLLQLPKPQSHPAFIVLSDINMKTDVKKLEKVVKEFTRNSVPIALEVTPILLDKFEKNIYYLHDNKKLLSYLQKLQIEGYPFILSSSTSPEKSLEYLALRKIYPAISREESSLFKGSIEEEGQSFYIKQMDNRTIYPMTVGSISDTDINPLYTVKQKIDYLLQVPSSMIGIQYPAYVNASYVQELVDVLKGHPQLELMNFRQTNQQVKSENVTIVQHKDGEQTIDLTFSKTERLNIVFDERPFELILWVLVLIVSLFVTLFFISTLRLRITLRKRLFEERKTTG
ncbi:hypothetical protein [Lysinibacillus sp. NPDC056220]|uniref:hypothetical protein n=1 Tax=Lysinibacillus sp. NPDC056220 TaxID=3398580 RepID=UPI003BF57E47